MFRHGNTEQVGVRPSFRSILLRRHNR